MKPDDQKTAVYALTRRGAELARTIAQGLAGSKGAVLFLPRRLEPDFGPEAEYFDSSSQALADNFNLFTGHIVIGATGLVVRHLAPLIRSKKEDPAVVVLPQDGRFAVSLLSGHLGGANRLAETVAGLTGGQAVISTATDVEGLPALEMLAREHQLEIEDFAGLPALSRRLVEGDRVPVYDPEGWLRPHLAPWAERFEFLDRPPEPGRGPHIRVDFRLGAELDPEALVLRPPALALGLGCHVGIDPAELEDFIRLCLTQAGLSIKAVGLLSTVEIRAEEPAFLEMSRLLNRPLIIHSREELSRVETPNPSAKVLERIGVPSVCEAAAMLAARTDRLEIKKQKNSRATLAAALIKP